MNSKLFILAIAILFGGCATQKRCWEKFPPEIKTDTIVHTETVYVDTTIYVELPGEIDTVEVPVHIIDTVPGEPIVVTYEEAKAKTDFAEARAWVENSKLKLELIQKDSLIVVKLDSVIQIKDHYVELYTVEIHKSPPKKKCPTRSIILYLLGGFFLGVVLIFIIRLKK